MAVTDLDAVRDYLSEPRCAVLSTVGPDGAPHQAVLHYLLEPDALVLNGRVDRRWARNLRDGGRVSVVVHDTEDSLHWVGIKGRATPIAHGQPAVEDAMTVARRYGEDSEEYRHQERVSFRLVPDRVFESVD
jgi:PPOX class probable F420-dependent enzyme